MQSNEAGEWRMCAERWEDGRGDRWMALITANGKLSLLLSIAFKQLTKLQQNEIKIKESPLMNLDLETPGIFVHCF